MGRNLLRQPKRILREFKAEGQRFRVVAYRIPEPAYNNNGCGPKTIDSIHPDDVIEGLFASIIENYVFAAALDEIAPGIIEFAAAESAAEVGVNGAAGSMLSLFAGEVQRDGLMPMLLRATELRDTTSAARFVAAWRDPAQRDLMRAAAARLLSPRDCDADAALAKEFRQWGLALKHKPLIGKDGKAIEERISPARATLRYVMDGSSRIGGYG